MNIVRRHLVPLWPAVACTVALACGCGQPTMVRNPDYEAWSAFSPGSYVTFEGVRKTGETAQSVRVTEKLVAKEADRVILERTVRVLDDRTGSEPLVTLRAELAKIAPADDPRTHPEATIKDMPREELRIAGKTFLCDVKELQVHAEFKGFVQGVQDVYARAHLHRDIPGRVAKLLLRAKTAHHAFELSGKAVDFKAVRGQED